MGLYSIIENKKKEQKRRERNKIAKVAAVTTVVGAAVGVASGVLFAPKSGKETREDIKVKSQELTENLKEKTSEATADLKEKVLQGKDGLLEAKTRIIKYLEDKKDVQAEVVTEEIAETENASFAEVEVIEEKEETEEV